MPIELDAYFDRIGYRGARSASLDTLRELHALHPAAMPFENLSPLLGLPVPLDAASVEAKMVRGGRGGYCFEHNLLFQLALDALGFRTRALGARVLWGPPAEVLPPRCHMLLLVDVQDEPWLVDVGFGGVTLPEPLRLLTNVAQRTTHEAFRIDALDEREYVLHVCLNGAWKPVYRFDLVEQLSADYKVANYFVSTHPDSVFVNHLLAARIDGDRRYTLFDNELNVHGAMPSERLLTTPGELRDVLTHIFRIRLPDETGQVSSEHLDATLARCLRAGIGGV